MTVKRSTVMPALFIVLLSPAAARGEDGYTVAGKGSVGGYLASGDRKLDDKRGVAGSNAELQAWLKAPNELSLQFDARFFGSGRAPENALREAYVNWDAGNASIRAGKQIIVWGRADRFNPTDVITPRNYEILSRDDDDQRFGAEGVQLKYLITEQYSFTSLALPAFRSSRIPSGLLPPGVPADRSRENYSSDNAQWGFKLDKSGQTLDWSASYYKGFSTLPEITISNTKTAILQNRRIWMAGLDFAATTAVWGIRGEAAYVHFEEHAIMPELYPQSYIYAVLGAERTLVDTLTLNLQWLHRRIAHFTDPLAVQGPLGPIATGNAMIHNQFDRKQDGASVSIRDKWLQDALRVEISGVFFFKHHDYLIRPEAQYDLNDQWTVAVFADRYGGQDSSFFGGLRKNSVVYAELNYRFGPFAK